TYGNIGVRERLEFTVIGASANEAARVESMCKALAQRVVISSAFAAAYGDKLAPLGRHELKDVEGSQELFTLPWLPSPGRSSSTSRARRGGSGRPPPASCRSLRPPGSRGSASRPVRASLSALRRRSARRPAAVSPPG